MPSHSSAQLRAALKLVQTLRDGGHVAYLAGGCVRDALLGLTPKDYDVATDALPERVRELWPRSRYVGEAFGVVLAMHGHGDDRVDIECATFRTDADYSDGRRPDAVTFTDALHDAQRRDFTINGLFADPPPDAETASDTDLLGATFSPDRIRDFVGGLHDLELGVIRAIGDPERRFGEDYLRMLRAARFAARFEFDMDPATAEAIRQHAPKLDQIARERIGGEVIRMLESGRPAAAVQWMHHLRLDKAVLGRVIEPFAAATLDRLDPQADVPTRLLAWLHDADVDIESAELQSLLVLTNDQVKAVEHTRRCLEDSEHLRGRVAQQKRWLSRPRAQQAMMLWDAKGEDREGWNHAQSLLTELSSDGIGLAPPPLVNGDDLVAAGLKPGPEFKRRLDTAYDAQLEGRVNDQTAALATAMAASEGKAGN